MSDFGLVVDDLVVAYGTTRAVDRVSLDVAAGTTLALVGPSGCGKSSLLRCVAGLVEAEQGSVTWNGVDLTTVATHRRPIGLMFQDHALFTHRSVLDNVAFGLEMQGVAAVERNRRAAELLGLVGLAGFGDRAVDSLSGGEAQRVALARALAPQPELLLLDEPLASLDRARRLELNAELMRILAELDQTAVYVTHDQDEAFAVADQVAVMDAGRLVRIGTPAEVWRDPRSVFVAGFVGHGPIIERDGAQFAVRPDAVAIAAPGIGEIDAVVATAAFQGDRFEIVAVDDDGLEWRTFTDDEVAVGTPVQLRLDPNRLARLTES